MHAALAARIRHDDLPVRLIAPAFTLGVSDGQLNGTDRMRYSLIGRELVNDNTDMHLAGQRRRRRRRRRRLRQAAGRHARRHPRAQRARRCSSPTARSSRASTRRPASASTSSPRSSSPATPTPRCALASRCTPAPARAAAAACSRTTPCRRSSPCSAWSRCTWSRRRPTIRGASKEFPDELVDCLVTMTEKGIRPRDIVTPASLRNALTVTIAMGGSTNVALHSVEIARAAGHRPLDGRDHPAGVQRALPSPAGAGEHAPVRRCTRWSTSTRRAASR